MSTVTRILNLESELKAEREKNAKHQENEDAGRMAPSELAMQGRIDHLEDEAKAEREKVAELKEAVQKHNLLRHIGSGECQCDSSVNMAPCMTCAALEIIKAFDL